MQAFGRNGQTDTFCKTRCWSRKKVMKRRLNQRGKYGNPQSGFQLVRNLRNNINNEVLAEGLL